MIPGVPYWRLSGFYFFYFAVLGSLSPFLGLYLADVGLTAQAIGMVNGVLMGTKIIAPNFWGWLAARTGQRLRIITIGSFLASVSFAGLFFRQDFMAIMILTFCYSFFWNAVLAQFETVTLQHLGDDSHRYSQIRLWGSIGFIVMVMLLGWALDLIAISWLVPIVWLLLTLIWLNCLVLKEAKASAVTEKSSVHWLIVLKQPQIIAFFVAAFLLQFSFGAYYSFFSLHLETVGYNRITIGSLWALGVLAEVILFLFIHRAIARLGVKKILFWSFLLTGIRWLMIAFFSNNLLLLLSAQLLHALSFGAAHAGCIEMVRRHFTGANSGQGQALYSALAFGVGGASGSVITGFYWDLAAGLMFSLSAVAVFLAALIIWFGLADDSQPVTSEGQY